MLLDSTGPIRFASLWVSEDPILDVCRRGERETVQAQLVRQRPIKWHPFLRGASLYVALPTVNVSLANSDSHSVPINVSPLETENFAHTQSQTHGHDAHCPERLGNMLQKSAEFLRGQELRFP